MAETPKYNREEIYGDKREKVKQEIAKDKDKIKYDTATPDGKAKLSEAWMNRANLAPAQKNHIFQKLGLKQAPDLTTAEGRKALTNAVEKWQKDPNQDKNRGTIGKADGVLGWATLEALDSDDELKNVEEVASKTPIQRENNVSNSNNIPNDGKGNLIIPSMKSDNNKVTLDSNIFGKISVPVSGPASIPDTESIVNVGTGKINTASKSTSEQAQEIRKGKTDINNEKIVEGKVAKLYTEKPDEFILDKATDGLPIFQNAERNSKEDMTALIRGLGIRVPRGVFYQKTSDGWVKYADNAKNLAQDGKFKTNSDLADNR